MSLEIYDGYIISKMYNVYDFNNLMNKLKSRIHDVLFEDLISEWTKLCSMILDFKTLYKEDSDKYIKDLLLIGYKFDGSGTYGINYLLKELMNRDKNKPISGTDIFNHSATIYIYPSQKSILLRAVSTKPIIINNILGRISEDGKCIHGEFKEIKEFWYWNYTDKPEAITNTNWNKRYKAWDKALKNNTNLNISINFGIHFALGFIGDVLKKIEENYETRIKSLVELKIDEMSLKAPEIIDDKEVYAQIEREIKDIIPKAYTISDLYNTIIEI